MYVFPRSIDSKIVHLIKYPVNVLQAIEHTVYVKLGIVNYHRIR